MFLPGGGTQTPPRLPRREQLRSLSPAFREGSSPRAAVPAGDPAPPEAGFLFPAISGVCYHRPNGGWANHDPDPPPPRRASPHPPQRPGPVRPDRRHSPVPLRRLLRCLPASRSRSRSRSRWCPAPTEPLPLHPAGDLGDFGGGGKKPQKPKPQTTQPPDNNKNNNKKKTNHQTPGKSAWKGIAKSPGRDHGRLGWG